MTFRARELTIQLHAAAEEENPDTCPGQSMGNQSDSCTVHEAPSAVELDELRQEMRQALARA